MPVTIPSNPTIIKKLKFCTETAVALTSCLFIACKEAIKRGEILPIYAGIQSINAIILEWISNANINKTLSVEKKDKTPNILKIIALLLFILFEMKAVIVLAKAEIIAIAESIKAAVFTSK